MLKSFELTGLLFCLAYASGMTAEDPIFNAAEKGEIAVLEKILTEHPEAVNARQAGGKSTPLHLAAIKGKTEAMALLIKFKADVNAVENAGMTPLHSAVLSGSKEAVALLLENKANPNAKSKPFELTPMMSTKDPEIIALLKKAGATE